MGTMKEIKEKELIKSVRKYHKLEKEQKSIKNKLLRARIDYIEKKLLFEIEELNERIDRMHKCVPLKKIKLHKCLIELIKYCYVPLRFWQVLCEITLFYSHYTF